MKAVCIANVTADRNLLTGGPVYWRHVISIYQLIKFERAHFGLLISLD
jgi:hypothetical protein